MDRKQSLRHSRSITRKVKSYKQSIEMHPHWTLMCARIHNRSTYYVDNYFHVG